MAPVAAAAASSSGNLSVSATVPGNCIVSAPSAVDFGIYNPATEGPGTVLDFTGPAFDITCTKGAPGVTISLDEGNFASGSTRNMQSERGTGTIRYEIYTDQQYMTVWNTNNKVSYNPAHNSATTIPLYGQIVGGQAVQPGRYSDTLLALVSF